MLFAKNKNNTISAFTIAEILITLGIIGVVAALTIPTLSENARNKELETAFKKSYSNVSGAINMIKSNAGTDDIYSIYSVYTTENGYYMNTEWTDEFYKVMPYVKVLSSSETLTYWNYTKTAQAQSKPPAYSVASINHVLKDGSLVTTGVNSINGIKISIQVDTNGLKKPNRYGFDVFRFYVGKDNKLVGMKTYDTHNYTAEELENDPNLDHNGFPCSKNSFSPLNGMGCAGYAIENICPDDPTKTYWECLPK